MGAHPYSQALVDSVASGFFAGETPAPQRAAIIGRGQCGTKERVVNRIGGAFRVSFGPIFGVFLTHTTSMNLRIRRKSTKNDPPKSIHLLSLSTTRS